MNKTLHKWKLMSTRLAGRPEKKMGKRYKEDLKIMKINNWPKCIQNWVKWKEVVEKAKTCKQ
jgi:hypothetical protein